MFRPLAAGTIAVVAPLVTMAAACREAPAPEVPPVTTAHPPSAMSVLSGPPMDAGPSTVEPTPIAPIDSPPPPPRSTVTAAFIEGTKKLEPSVCTRLFIYAARGTVTVKSTLPQSKDPNGDSLSQGDVVVITHSEPVEVKAPGLAVQVLNEFDCQVLSKPAPQKTVIRSKDVPELKWADGKMKAQMLVPAKTSPHAYFGRLEGTAAVAEHQHVAAGETLIAIEASGTFTIAGKEGRLGPKQIVNVPQATMHSWKPDQGTKLVAVQVYDPPGPETRFIELAAAAASDAGPPPAQLSTGDAGKK
jgi:mannose-6-phosphate isomerase-like protein (cupin superfamily)